MPTGPKGQKRPADLIGCAVMVGRIATGEIEETLKKPSGKVKSGKAGAAARKKDYGNDSKLNAPISHYHGLFTDYLTKRGLRGAIHTSRGLRGIS